MEKKEKALKKTNDLLSPTRHIVRKYREETNDLHSQASSMKVSLFKQLFTYLFANKTF